MQFRQSARWLQPQLHLYRALAGIEVDRRHARALVGEGHGDVDRRRRLAGAALFIGEDDAMRAKGLALGGSLENAVVSIQVRGVRERVAGADRALSAALGLDEFVQLVELAQSLRTSSASNALATERRIE